MRDCRLLIIHFSYILDQIQALRHSVNYLVYLNLSDSLLKSVFERRAASFSLSKFRQWKQQTYTIFTTLTPEETT